jgi:mannose-1-phosphate guanylyltransferase
MACVECALEAVNARPEVVVLLGIAPDRPEVEYGWIEPAEPILGRWSWPIYRVRRFWEKPSRAIAERLEAAGCLWNCFVVVARPSTLEQLIRRATPDLYEAFTPLRGRLGTPCEEETARTVYGRLPSTDLSRHVFQPCAERLAVLPVSGVGRTDLGDPARLHEARARLGWQPARV